MIIPAKFDYVRPGEPGRDPGDRSRREGEAKLLSAGYSHSLIELVRLSTGLLVDLRDERYRASTASSRPTTTSSIGARATHRQIHEAEVIREAIPNSCTT